MADNLPDGITPGNIPRELCERPQWVAWQYEQRRGKRTKVPYSPVTGERASSTDPATWSTFKAATTAALGLGPDAGIGFVVTADDPYVGVDLDHCIEEAGHVAEWAKKIVDRLASYTERTPSGVGLRVWVKIAGELPAKGRRKGPIELYSNGRYFTLTGDHLAGTPAAIEERTDELKALHTELFPLPKARQAARRQAAERLALDDAALLEKASAAKDGAKFDALWRGDTSAYGDDQSRADLALCSLLWFWTQGDRARVERLFRRSGLMREKWDEQRGDRTYGERTLDTVQAGGGEVYSGGQSDKPPANGNDVPHVAAGPAGSTNGSKPATGDSLADRLAEIATRAKQDAGAPFEPDAIQAQQEAMRDKALFARHRQALKKANSSIDLFDLTKHLKAAAQLNGDDADDDSTQARGRTPLYQHWVKALQEAGARLIWTDTKEAFLQLPTGEVMAVRSDDAALWFQSRTDPEAFYLSDKWNKAAGALRSVCSQCGEGATVHRQAHADFSSGTVYVGCDGGREVYRVTPDRIERVRNGTDGVLILGGCAPVLNTDLAPTGELSRWLDEDVWATPVARLQMAIVAPLLALGARSFDARPLLAAIGPKGSGKTTSMQQLGTAISGQRTIAQAIKPEERENEARLVNEAFAVFDNVDAPPRGVPVSDFLATAATQQVASIRKMRSEGEIVEKPITAFVAVTSFTISTCLRRSDVMDRALVLEFRRPEEGEVREAAGRVPDRDKLWTDLLILLQRSLRRWAETPAGSNIRSIEFARFAYALLPRPAALALEKTILRLQSSTAGLDDPILDKLEVGAPTQPMTTQELLDLWWPPDQGFRRGEDPDKPANAYVLGNRLRTKAGRLGDWRLISERDPVRNVTLWSFRREKYEGVLRDEDAAELLRGLMAGETEWQPTPTSSPDEQLAVIVPTNGNGAHPNGNGCSGAFHSEQAQPWSCKHCSGDDFLDQGGYRLCGDCGKGESLAAAVRPLGLDVLKEARAAGARLSVSKAGRLNVEDWGTASQKLRGRVHAHEAAIVGILEREAGQKRLTDAVGMEGTQE